SDHDRAGSEGRVSDAGLVAIEPLHDLTSSSVGELVAESERLGLRLVRRLADEWATGANRFDRPGEILFGAFIDGRLVGVGGLNIDPYAGDERVGRLRHLYVLSAFRRMGVGRQLEIGRASCRERVESGVGGGCVKRRIEQDGV